LSGEAVERRQKTQFETSRNQNIHIQRTNTT
jgi:hypothetical protein